MKIDLTNYKRSESGKSRYVPKGALKLSQLLDLSYQQLDELEGQNSRTFHSKKSTDKEKRIAEVNVMRIRRRKRQLQRAGPFEWTIQVRHDDVRPPTTTSQYLRVEEHIDEELFYKHREEHLKEIRKTIRDTRDVEIKVDIKDDGWWIEFLREKMVVERTHIKTMFSEAEVRQILRAGTLSLAERMMKVLLNLNPVKERKK